LLVPAALKAAAAAADVPASPDAAAAAAAVSACKRGMTGCQQETRYLKGMDSPLSAV